MINPIEQKLQRYWDRIQRALQVLQRAQRYLPKTSTEMERCTDSSGGAAVSEPVKITLGTRVVVDIGGADFNLGRVYELTWAPVEDYVFKIASPDGTFTTKIIGGQMRLELNCELPIVMEP